MLQVTTQNVLSEYLFYKKNLYFLFKHRIAMFMFNINKGMSYDCIKSMFKINDTHNHDTTYK